MTKNKKIVLIVVILVVVFGVWLVVGKKSSPKQKSAVSATTTQVVIKQDAFNSTYSIDGVTVKLAAGKADQGTGTTSATKVKTQAFGNSVQGELNNDGIKDSALVLIKDQGGSGKFYYIVATLGNKDGTSTGLKAALLGDRIQMRSLSISNEQVNVTYLERKPKDSMTTKPSVLVVKHFKAVNGELQEVK